MSENNIMVSVIVTTYNQELYIEQALEGILNQKVSFQYEIIVGDDCSTDCTGEIIKGIYLKYPDRIKIVTNKKNIGEQKNTCRLLRLCRGKYIAVCEGDDYWTDETKLARQVQFLEENPQYIGTAHNVLCVNEYGKKMNRKKIDFPYQKQHIYGRENALKYEELGQMSSYVYRNIWLEATKREFQLFENCHANTDVKLNATLGLMGDVYFFEDVWSCRRRIFHGEGWTAYAFNNNVRDYSYGSCINLKRYVKERFQEEMEVENFLFQMRYGAIKIFINDPSQINLRVIQKIYKIKGDTTIKMVRDIVRIGIMEKIWKTRAMEYERVYQNIKRYGYFSPINYWVADNGKCIYIQNPKVACSSIKASMYHLSDEIQDYEEVHNRLLKKGNKLEKRQKLNRDYPDAFKFTFVRNPYERLVSCYVNKFITDKEKGKENYFKEYFVRKMQEVKSFHEFAYRIFFIPDRIADWHFRSQYCTTHSTNHQVQVDYIGKYEHLGKEFGEIASRYQFAPLEWYNKSYDYDWRDFYTLGTAVFVYIRYHKDFRLYGYQGEFAGLIKYIVGNRKIRKGRGNI